MAERAVCIHPHVLFAVEEASGADQVVSLSMAALEVVWQHLVGMPVALAGAQCSTP